MEEEEENYELDYAIEPHLYELCAYSIIILPLFSVYTLCNENKAKNKALFIGILFGITFLLLYFLFFYFISKKYINIFFPSFFQELERIIVFLYIFKSKENKDINCIIYGMGNISLINSIVFGGNYIYHLYYFYKIRKLINNNKTESETFLNLIDEYDYLNYNFTDLESVTWYIIRITFLYCLDITYSVLIWFALKIKIKRNYLLIIIAYFEHLIADFLLYLIKDYIQNWKLNCLVSIYYIFNIFIGLDIYMRYSIKVKINEKKYFFLE